MDALDTACLDPQPIGARLTTLRLAAGYPTVDALAEAASVKREYIQLYEKKLVGGVIDWRVRAIAKTLGVPVAEVAGIPDRGPKTHPMRTYNTQGAKVKARHERGKLAPATETRTCAHRPCGKEFTVKVTARNRYCCNPCSWAAQKQRKREREAPDKLQKVVLPPVVIAPKPPRICAGIGCDTDISSLGTRRVYCGTRCREKAEGKAYRERRKARMRNVRPDHPIARPIGPPCSGYWAAKPREGLTRDAPLCYNGRAEAPPTEVETR